MGIELTDHDRELLAGSNFAHLATVMPDGGPQSTPVWIDVDGNTIIFNTAEGRAKIKNLRRDPRVALSVTDGENPYDMISIRGRVVEDTHDGADDHINKLSKQYLGEDEYPFRQPGEERVIVKIEPISIHRFAG